MTKITMDSISRADLHKLVIELQKRVDVLEKENETQSEAIIKLMDAVLQLQNLQGE